MQTEVTQTIVEKIKKLNLEQQKEVLEFVEQKISTIEKKETRPIWEIAREISESIPLEEWEKLPSDGSVNHDHYLYGAPKNINEKNFRRFGILDRIDKSGGSMV